MAGCFASLDYTDSCTPRQGDEWKPTTQITATARTFESLSDRGGKFQVENCGDKRWLYPCRTWLKKMPPPRDATSCLGRMPPGSTAGTWVHFCGRMLLQNHQLVLDCSAHRRLVGRFCPRLHHTQSVVFPLEFIHGGPLSCDPLCSACTRRKLHVQSSCQCRKSTQPCAAGSQYVCHGEGKSRTPCSSYQVPAWLARIGRTRSLSRRSWVRLTRHPVPAGEEKQR